ncbi:embryonal Fyn-associated substrate [Gadus macrocephalus]|uniref:embryonal Fyn-associated substrate n=1 Tax=Gadus macrocephalus TaxID=80720 RepID=UPI0028CB7303|nr:embryonal Fyn-associated substrate [Gadus macrocephalus]
MSLSTVLAKALYDNAAESPEELAFRKGDILMVLEQERSGSPGWWLCSLHGRQGIAPANRLRLLHTAAPPPTPPPGSEPARRGPGEDSVYLFPPGPALCRTRVSASAEDIDGIYRAPTAAGTGEGLYQSPGSGPPATRPGELRREEGGRPRSHSSSGTRPRPDWDIGVAGRPRSPSLRGRGSEAGTLYQIPPTPSGPQHPRQQAGVPPGPEAVYLSPSGGHRAAEDPQDSTYLLPRETGTDCYGTPRGTPLGEDDVYQTPTGGAAPVLCNGTSSVPQEIPAVYQSPAAAGAHRNAVPPSPLAAHQKPASSPGPKAKGAPPNPAVARGKASPAAHHRGSPMLIRASQGRVPGSPNFARKPPPPAPPIRGVTRKDVPATPPASPAGPEAKPATKRFSREGAPSGQKERTGLESKNNAHNKKTEAQDHEDPVDEQVYDTPPRGRWQRPVPSSLGGHDVNDEDEDDGVYNMPRALPRPTDPLAEVYDVPTITLNASTTDPHLAGSACTTLEAVDDVYSVPTLPGAPGPADPCGGLSVEKGGGGDASQTDCGIYDMPALTVDGLPHSSSSSSSASTRRLSISSNGSGDVQWRASLSGLVQSVLAAAACPASAPSSRDLAASLGEILSSWKVSHPADPPLQLAGARLSELLPALSAAGSAPPAAGLLSLVQRALEDSLLLLQTQGRPRLPSQDSLSRRPLPALPVAAAADGGKSSGGGGGGGGMGSRKGSWIQERPLPPTPQPAFPLPAAPGPVTVTLGCCDDEDDPSNEYAGIGLTPAPAPLPTGDSVGYVKLQGKPEPPPPETPTENGLTITADTRVTPSPPLPASLSLEDSELLFFYSSQSLAHLSCLADSIDGLFGSVQGSQPPRVFVARGKSLIVTAHKLVFIGDTLSRLLSSPDLRAKVTTSSGRLCQSLKTVVVATKGAAQNYPSVAATQEMVDRVAELSQQAAGFSGLLQRLAEIS